jgi:hypothetical protein
VDERPPRRPASVVMLAAVCALVLVAVAGAVVLATRGGGDTPERQAQTTPTPSPTAHHSATPKKTSTPTPTDTPAPTATATPTATAQSVSGSPDLSEAKTLQLAGYSARQAGDYQTALGKAKDALAACGDAHELNPCGYALYEEGVALNRSGDPGDAIPILQQRLDQYGDDSSGSVSKELKDAQKSAGGPASGPKGDKGRGHGRGGD